MTKTLERTRALPHSVLDAIKLGIWDYEPENGDAIAFPATQAMPGTSEKITVLAQRVAKGLPLWHPRDRRTFDDRS